MVRTLCVVAVLGVLSSVAVARTSAPASSPECNVTMPCIGVDKPNWLRQPMPVTSDFSRYSSGSLSMSGIVAPLAAKLASIQAACPGTQMISGVRHTKIAGTNVMSLHAQGKAVDVRGPYSCIYAQLRDWSGGYSIDAVRMRHIHISYDEAGGREMGLRFTHGLGRPNYWRQANT